VETVVHLIRHGRVHNPENVRYGRAPGFHLSAVGRDQARAAALRLRELGRPLAALVTSPLERAVETAASIAALLRVPAVHDARVIEAESHFDGLHRWAFALPTHWPWLRNPAMPSWGEPFAEVAARMRTVIDEQRVRHPGGAIAIVSHQSPIWIARRAYEAPGMPPWLGPVHCTQGSLTSLRFAGDRYLGHTYWAP
jgi:broad specificity phosphatase PhoE